MNKRILIALAAAVTLAACGADNNPPVPGVGVLNGPSDDCRPTAERALCPNMPTTN